MAAEGAHDDEVGEGLGGVVKIPRERGREIVDGGEQAAAVEHLAEFEAGFGVVSRAGEQAAGDIKQLAVGCAALRGVGEFEEQRIHQTHTELAAAVGREHNPQPGADEAGEPSVVERGDGAGVEVGGERQTLHGAHAAGGADDGAAGGEIGGAGVGAEVAAGIDGFVESRFERLGGGGEGGEEGVGRGDHGVLQARDERGDEGAGRAAEQRDPEDGETWGEEGDVEEQGATVEHGGGALHHGAVGHDIGAAEIGLAAKPCGVAEGERDGAHDVAEGNGLGERAGPMREEHGGEAAHEVDEDGERGAAGADDEAGAQGGERDGAGGEGALDFEAAGEVGREGDGGGDEAAEVEDLFHAGAGGGAGKVIGEDEVEVGEGALGEAGAGRHGVDEVEGVVGPGEGFFEFEQGKEVAAAPLDGGGRVVVVGRGGRGLVAGETAATEVRSEGGEEGATDEARGTGHGDDGARGGGAGEFGGGGRGRRRHEGGGRELRRGAIGMWFGQ